MGSAVPTARDMMTRKLVTLEPDTPIGDAISTLLRYQISGAPVVGEAGELLGLLSEYDCMKALASGEFYEQDAAYAGKTAADLMTCAAYTIPPEMELYAVAHTFVTHRVRRLPVIEDGKVIGQVSRRDVLKAVDRLSHHRHSRKRYPDYPADRRPMSDYPADSGHPRWVRRH